MDRADIIRTLRPTVEEAKARVALVEALYLLETSEHSYIAAVARKDAMDAELKTKRADTDIELERLERYKTHAIEEARRGVDLARAQSSATMERLRSEIAGLEKKKEDVHVELQSGINERHTRLGELDARVRDLEARQAKAEKALDMAAAAAKR